MLLDGLARTRIAVAALATIAATAWADPLRPQWVTPGSDWVLHVDVERATASSELRPVFDLIASSAWGASLADMGIDATMDVRSLTIFGTLARDTGDRHTTTLLVGGDTLRDAITGYVDAHSGYPVTLDPSEDDGDDARTSPGAWAVDALDVHVGLVPLAQDSEGPTHVALLTDRLDTLQAALDAVLSPATPVLEPQPLHADRDATAEHETGEPLMGMNTPHLLPLDPPEGAVVYARATGLWDAQPPPSSDLLGLSREATAFLGYRAARSDTVFEAGLRIVAGSESEGARVMESLNRAVDFAATRTADLADGDASMLRLLTLVKSCRITRQGRTVELELERRLSPTIAADPPRLPARPPASPDRDREL